MDVCGLMSADFLRSALTLAMLIMFVTVVVLFFALAGHKALVKARERRLHKLREHYAAALSLWLVEKDASFPSIKNAGGPRAALHYDALCAVLIHAVSALSGDFQERVKQLAWDSGLASYLMRIAEKSHGARRLAAIERLGLLRLSDAKLFLHSLLPRSSDLEVKVRLAVALSFVATNPRDVEAVNNILANVDFVSSKLVEYIYANIIESFVNKGLSNDLLACLRALKDDLATPVTVKKSMIEACGIAGFSAAREIIGSFWEQYNALPEMRISCIRALGRMGGVEGARVIERGLEDEDWRVRAVAATYASVCGLSAIAGLKRCLRDKSYYVRLRAAASLAKLGPEGLRVLIEEKEGSDQFARDAVRYALRRTNDCA